MCFFYRGRLLDEASYTLDASYVSAGERMNDFPATRLVYYGTQQTSAQQSDLFDLAFTYIHCVAVVAFDGATCEELGVVVSIRPSSRSTAGRDSGGDVMIQWRWRK